MAKTRIQWNRPAFEELRRTPEIGREIEDEVNRILGEVGDFDGVNYAGGIEDGKSRTRGYVVTVSGEAITDEAENHTLLRALASGGGLG